jgi:hypothetical protein
MLPIRNAPNIHLSRVQNARLTNFIDKFSDIKMEDYFGVKSNPNTHLKFRVIKCHNEVLFAIKYIKKNTLYKFDLPLELNNLIASYTDDYIIINIRISYGKDYPFRAPIWSLFNVYTNIHNPVLDLKQYYKYLVDLQNDQYKLFIVNNFVNNNYMYTNNDQWSPAITIEHEILSFITRINHFEYII